MLFTSFQYFAFLLAVLVGYYVLPQRRRNWLLLIASFCFYFCFDWRFGWLLLWQTAICYFAAVWQEDSRRNTRLPIALAAILSFGTLAVFKYCNFCLESFGLLFNALGLAYVVPHLDILLPIGISFYIFQSFGYVLDVGRQAISAERNFADFALFVAFFPQIAAGPIGRAPELLPQFKQAKNLDWRGIESGVAQILWGLFKKLVIADRLAAYVNTVYGDVGNASGSSLLTAVIFFSIQIYCDFSGYSDMAIGSARLFGIELRKNFDFPYFAVGINDFWRRWHMSLTSWFRDYLYIPLGGNRCGGMRWALNVMIVFLVSGLWHGAAWTFVVWGGLHGLLMLAETVCFDKKLVQCGNFTMRLSAGVITFILVSVAWVFFCMPSFGAAVDVLAGIADWQGRLSFGGSQVTFALNVMLLLAFGITEIVNCRWRNKFLAPAPLRGCWYGLMLAAVALLGQTSEGFIYLHF